MIRLLTAAGTLEQAKDLIHAGTDQVLVGEKVFGLRLSGYLTVEEIKELTDYAHGYGVDIIVAANAILHNEQIKQTRDYLKKIKATGADYLLVGDTGLIQIMKDPEYSIPFIYDAATLMTSSGQVNFWSQFGAKASFAACEVPFYELKQMVQEAVIPLYYQVYGATCIHHSGRKLLKNYFNYIGEDPEHFADHHLALTIHNQPETHYAIYEDHHGTHIFANNDLNLLPYLTDLQSAGIDHWYLDGILCPADHYLAIVRIFDQARQYIEAGKWSEAVAGELDQALRQAQPQHRDLDTGFFLHEPGTVR